MSLSACSLPLNKLGKDENNENSKDDGKNENIEVGEADLNALLGYDAEKLLNTEEAKDFEDIDIEANVKPYDVRRILRVLVVLIKVNILENITLKL